MGKPGKAATRGPHGPIPTWPSSLAPWDPDGAGNLAQKARLLQVARQVISQIPEVRPGKVAALKESIRQGAYRLDLWKLTKVILPGLLVFLDSQKHSLDYLDLATLLARDPSLVPEYLTLQGKNPLYLPEAIQVLLRTLEVRDHYTRRHSARVTAIALRFADYLGSPPQYQKFLKTAGYLHDLGKVALCPDLLSKAGTLTKGERISIEAHPPLGEKILEPLGLRPQEKEIILHHHERWDGKGYPQGLAGKEIPFSCRLLSLADVFEALTSDRPHRPRKTVDEALTIIQAQAGTQFDPDLVREFIKLAPLIRT